ncbi:MAG: cytidylate kinase family protein [Clostridia bacterium]|nr:cytidylate kinase family protein [Clostridia bacterium]
MHIAISGKLGSGKSTVCGILNKDHGLEIYSTGKIQRAIAEKMGITTLELNRRMASDTKLDHEIDDTVNAVSRRRSDECLVFDSRMAWHFAVNAYKVYMYVDPTVAAKRVMGDDRGSVEKYKGTEDARAQLKARSEEENRRYKEIYGVDNFDYSNYDLIVDSTSADQFEIAKLIMDSFAENAKGIFLAPKCLFPTALPEEDGSDELRIFVHDGFNFVSAGHRLLPGFGKSGAHFAKAALETDEAAIRRALSSAKRRGRKLLKTYETLCGIGYESVPEAYIRRTK